MNITMLGAGAMGCLFGGLLAESGQNVTLVDINDAHLNQIRKQGLRLETDHGDRCLRGMTVLRPEQAVQAGQAPDLLIVFTKSTHTDAALRGVARLLAAPTLVLTLQNGLGNVEAVSRHVDPARLLVGMTTWPADMVGPGHVRSHGDGMVRLLSATGGVSESASHIAAVLDAAGLQCQEDPQVWRAIWEKVAFNTALNSLCAVTGCTVGELDRAPDGPGLAREVVAEVIAVAHASGVDADAASCQASVAHAIAYHRDHKPSMLQDVLAKRPTEIEAINGEVVARAHRAGVPVPNTEMLLRLVRLIQARDADTARMSC